MCDEHMQQSVALITSSSFFIDFEERINSLNTPRDINKHNYIQVNSKQIFT